ncbi:MAG: hypothetical protein M3Y18_02855 [Candidatus Eremiobacteraeota bacterium]|nr:hypothetical protein [Candidatus Eremiobacteraeota bacterium]
MSSERDNWNSPEAPRRYSDMIDRPLRAIALGTLVLFAPALAAAQSPMHGVRAKSQPAAPKTRMHVEFNVEVNSKGQVVAVKSGKSSPDDMLNAELYGNVLQIFIRRPDGSAVPGLYRVGYDYEPVHKKITRKVALIYKSNKWANRQGAANQMMDVVQRQYRAYAARQKQAAAHRAQQAKNLPSLDKITKPTASPSPHA